jgi:hypothetical protein
MCKTNQDSKPRLLKSNVKMSQMTWKLSSENMMIMNKSITPRLTMVTGNTDTFVIRMDRKGKVLLFSVSYGFLYLHSH